MKTIEIKIPKCLCGCEGDLIIKMFDGIVDYMICDCCGQPVDREDQAGPGKDGE